MTLLWPIIVLYGSTHRDTHACAFTLICILVHPFLNSHKHACTHTFMDAHQCAHTDTCTHMHMYAHAHIHTHSLMYCAQAHDLTHMHIHMHSRMLRARSISNTPCFSPQRVAERRSGLRTAVCPCPWCCREPLLLTPGVPFLPLFLPPARLCLFHTPARRFNGIFL